METCAVCFGAIEPAMRVDHLKFHKRHDHHYSLCVSLFSTGLGNPLNLCNCMMQTIYV